ncbi:MAG: hypothetical protein DHS80DRAFT_24867 [Piptocephalis tieghemiana]|nr:MAG: hypothetical protein DHS80DRAFT_24867 [Piptocephalis tieghemiana]
MNHPWEELGTIEGDQSKQTRTTPGTQGKVRLLRRSASDTNNPGALSGAVTQAQTNLEVWNLANRGRTHDIVQEDTAMTTTTYVAPVRMLRRPKPCPSSPQGQEGQGDDRTTGLSRQGEERQRMRGRQEAYARARERIFGEKGTEVTFSSSSNGERIGDGSGGGGMQQRRDKGSRGMGGRRGRGRRGRGGGGERGASGMDRRG